MYHEAIQSQIPLAFLKQKDWTPNTGPDLATEIGDSDDQPGLETSLPISAQVQYLHD